MWTRSSRRTGAAAQGFAALCAKEGHSAEYLFHLLEILRPTLIRLGAGTTFLETSRREIRKVQVRVPDEDEQRRIAAALKLADDAIQKARAEMDAARQLRRSAAFEMLEKGMPGRHADFLLTKHWTYPAGWDLVCVKHLLADMDAGSSPMCEAEPAKPGQWGVLKVSAVSWDRFEEFENKAELKRSLLQNLLTGKIEFQKGPFMPELTERRRPIRVRTLFNEETTVEREIIEHLKAPSWAGPGARATP
jgi:restriction endonuclease S subunit